MLNRICRGLGWTGLVVIEIGLILLIACVIAAGFIAAILALPR